MRPLDQAGSRGNFTLDFERADGAMWMTIHRWIHIIPVDDNEIDIVWYFKVDTLGPFLDLILLNNTVLPYAVGLLMGGFDENVTEAEETEAERARTGGRAVGAVNEPLHVAFYHKVRQGEGEREREREKEKERERERERER